MALTHSTTARSAAGDAVVDLVDTGSATTTGKILIKDSSSTTVATLVWAATNAFSSATDGVATMNAIQSDTAAAGGNAATFHFVNRDGTEIFRGTISTSTATADLALTSTVIGAGDTVTISSLTYSAST